MPLSLMYITNNPKVALIAEKVGVERIWVDLETLGKEERQKNMNAVLSYHTVEDVRTIAKVLTKSELLVRVNPWHIGSSDEIEAVIAAGAERIMLPMWKTPEEVDAFLKAINKRVHTTLLLETKEAAECLDAVLENPLIEEIHIGLNDLHLSYGLNFMFEPLANGMVEKLIEKCRAKGIPCGFGGIARIGEGLLPAEKIVMEHYRLGSTRAILSRTFCNAEEVGDLEAIDQVFSTEIDRLRKCEAALDTVDADAYAENKRIVREKVEQIAQKIKRLRSNSRNERFSDEEIGSTNG